VTGITAEGARQSARTWVRETASAIPGYRAAFIAGSVASLPGDAPVPPWSDTDVMVVLDGEAPIKAGKFLRDGVLLEGSYLSRQSLDDPEAILGAYHLAHAVSAGLIVNDPSGWLAEVQAVVCREFPRRSRVEQRCAVARATVEAGLQYLTDIGSLAERAQAWVFPAGIMTHVLLVAGLRNPTVRRRYETVGDLLAEHDRLPLFERLLDVLGCRDMGRAQVERHLDAITALFDAAAPVAAPSYRFASDVTAISRPISVDGSWDMIQRGYHREAVFWLVVTASRSLQKLAHGVGAEAAKAPEPALRELLADLGIVTHDDVLARRDQALDLLPEVWQAAEGIMASNSRIVP
jgi:hypothetical protein